MVMRLAAGVNRLEHIEGSGEDRKLACEACSLPGIDRFRPSASI